MPLRARLARALQRGRVDGEEAGDSRSAAEVPFRARLALARVALRSVRPARARRAAHCASEGVVPCRARHALRHRIWWECLPRSSTCVRLCGARQLEIRPVEGVPRITRHRCAAPEGGRCRSVSNRAVRHVDESTRACGALRGRWGPRACGARSAPCAVEDVSILARVRRDRGTSCVRGGAARGERVRGWAEGDGTGRRGELGGRAHARA